MRTPLVVAGIWKTKYLLSPSSFVTEVAAALPVQFSSLALSVAQSPASPSPAKT